MIAIHHKNRSVLQLNGADTLTFLQGLITNDIETLAENEVLYTAMLTPSGRYQFDFFLYKGEGDSVCLDIDTHFSSDLLKRLMLFKLRSDVTIRDISKETHVVTYHDMEPQKNFTFQDPRHLNMGYRGLVLGDLPKDISDDTSFYNELCLKNCIPRSGIELIPEKTIPLEANLEELNALSFTKGCYLGQELTARTKHQGMVRKQLYPVLIEGNITSKDLENGIILYEEDKKIGVLLSAENGYGIAKLRKEAVENREVPLTFSGLVTDTKRERCKIVYFPHKQQAM